MVVVSQREGGGQMRAILKNWRHYMYVSATLATFLLATGAKFKNH